MHKSFIYAAKDHCNCKGYWRPSQSLVKNNASRVMLYNMKLETMTVSKGSQA